VIASPRKRESNAAVLYELLQLSPTIFAAMRQKVLRALRVAREAAKKTNRRVVKFP
jgi:hypothetical protein